MAWLIEVYAASVECADTESITVDDVFVIIGSVLVDDQSHGFITPRMAVGPGETHDMGGYPTGPGQLYRGWSDSPRLGFIVRGYDIDDNDKWVDNRETIKEVVEEIEKITDDIPVVGDIVSVAAKIPDVVDVFVDADSNDLVLGNISWIDLAVGPPERTITEWRTIRTRRDDDTGYSSSDYTLNLRIVHVQTTGSLGEATVPRLRPHRGSELDDWIGAWQGPHVNCAISRATSALGASDVLTVEISEQVDGQTTQIRERAVRINKPYLADALSEPSDIPTSREPQENQGGGLIGSGTVEGRAAEEGGGALGGLRTEREGRGGIAITESIVDVLGRSRAGGWTSQADYLSVDQDVVLELYQQRVGGQLVGARIRYVRPASIPTRAGAPAAGRVAGAPRRLKRWSRAPAPESRRPPDSRMTTGATPCNATPIAQEPELQKALDRVGITPQQLFDFHRTLAERVASTPEWVDPNLHRSPGLGARPLRSWHINPDALDSKLRNLLDGSTTSRYERSRRPVVRLA